MFVPAFVVALIVATPPAPVVALMVAAPPALVDGHAGYVIVIVPDGVVVPLLTAPGDAKAVATCPRLFALTP